MERARRAVSLWSLTRSTWYESEFRGTFTEPPVSGVNETPTTVVRKERRLILAGTGKRAARRVRIKPALLTWPVPDPFDLGGPLHDPSKKAIISTEKPQKFVSVREYNLIKIDLRSGVKLALPLAKSIICTSYYNDW